MTFLVIVLALAAVIWIVTISTQDGLLFSAALHVAR